MTQCHEDETAAAALAARGPLELGRGPVFTFPLTEEAQDERAPLHVQTHTIYSTRTCTAPDLRRVQRLKSKRLVNSTAEPCFGLRVRRHRRESLSLNLITFLRAT